MSRIAALIVLGVFAVAFSAASTAAELPVYPDPDTEKTCETPGESPECALKTFWLCSEKSVAICKMVGLDVQPDGSQHKDDETAAGLAWTKPWAQPWTELLNVTHSNYTVWELKGLRENTSQRLRGVARRSLTGSHEMMIRMVNPRGEEEKESVFLVQRKGVWMATGFARWREGDVLNTCEKRKLGSLACRYTVNGLSPWQYEPPAPPPVITEPPQVPVVP
jgi:hypothetical protein